MEDILAGGLFKHGWQPEEAKFGHGRIREVIITAFFHNLSPREITLEVCLFLLSLWVPQLAASQANPAGYCFDNKPSNSPFELKIEL